MSLDAARQREKEAEKAAIARKRRKAAMEREYNKIYKDCYKRQVRIVVLHAFETLDKTLVIGKKNMGLEMCTMAGLDISQRMQPVTDASQLSSYHSAYQFPQLPFGGRCFKRLSNFKETELCWHGLHRKLS